MRFVSATGLFIVSSYAAFGQSTPVTLSFEVASIKPAQPPTDGLLMVRMSTDAGRVDFQNVSLKDMIRAAYKVKDHQISGPDWMSSERYIVSAKLPANTTKDQVPAMLQALLADRFKLKLQKDQKSMPAYALVVAKGGPKLHEAEGKDGLRMMMGPKGRHMTGISTMSGLADMLSNVMDRPVIDQTALKGNFDMDLEWSGDDGGGAMRFGLPPRGSGGPEGGGGEGRHQDESADAPSIFTSLQDKMGLKLDPRKEQVDFLVIENAEKVPTEN
jgi:uncharacterized protein (TIGR03435 family)